MRSLQRFTKSIALTLSALALGLVHAPATANGGGVAENITALARQNAAFALELYARLKDRPGNLFFSPHSLSTALGMTYAGARGQTETQMAKVLKFARGPEPLHPAFRALQDSLNDPDQKRGFELQVANALWGQQGYAFLPDFLRLVEENYDGGLRQVDFRSATETARNTINAWVEEATRDKIKELLKQGVVDDRTRLVLTNAIYFKGDWANPFDKKLTSDRPFTVGPGRTVDTPMMRQTAEFRYMEDAQTQALELSYAGRALSMVALLPRETDGLGALEADLAPDRLNRRLQGLQTQRVSLFLPRFKTTSEFSLVETLGAMGMADAFGDRADFSGMNGRRDLFISAVVHKAYVDVNEEGTEAAAATGVAMSLKSMVPSPPVVFRADHPFLFLIRHNPTGALLFLGRVVNPASE